MRPHGVRGGRGEREKAKGGRGNGIQGMGEKLGRAAGTGLARRATISLAHSLLFPPFLLPPSPHSICPPAHCKPARLSTTGPSLRPRWCRMKSSNLSFPRKQIPCESLRACRRRRRRRSCTSGCFSSPGSKRKGALPNRPARPPASRRASARLPPPHPRPLGHQHTHTGGPARAKGPGGGVRSKLPREQGHCSAPQRTGGPALAPRLGGEAGALGEAADVGLGEVADWEEGVAQLVLPDPIRAWTRAAAAAQQAALRWGAFAGAGLGPAAARPAR
jgi:hypothetical protein